MHSVLVNGTNAISMPISYRLQFDMLAVPCFWWYRAPSVSAPTADESIRPTLVYPYAVS